MDLAGLRARFEKAEDFAFGAEEDDAVWIERPGARFLVRRSDFRPERLALEFGDEEPRVYDVRFLWPEESFEIDVPEDIRRELEP